jgi:hypothetical protein
MDNGDMEVINKIMPSQNPYRVDTIGRNFTYIKSNHRRRLILWRNLNKIREEVKLQKIEIKF